MASASIFGGSKRAFDGLIIHDSDSIEFGSAGSGESIGGNGTDLVLNSGAELLLSATTDVVIPVSVGLHFGDGAEKIESDNTDMSINSGGAINLTATTDVVVPANVGVTFGTGEKIEGDNTDLTVTSGGLINLTATSDVVLPVNIGLHFGDGAEKIESDNTDLTINSGGLINLTATTAVVGPASTVDAVGYSGQLRVSYDFAVEGGSQGTIDLGKSLPDNAVVTRGYYEVTTGVSSATGPGDATMSIDIPTNDVAGLKAAAVVSSIGTVGFHECIQTGAASAFSTKTTAARSIGITVGVEDLNAGVFTLFLDYFVSV